MFLPLFSPRRSLVFAAAAPTVSPPDEGKTARFFRNPPRRDDGPPPDDSQNNEGYNPLSEREQKAYLILAGIGCLPFLLLIILALITHSPWMAN